MGDVRADGRLDGPVDAWHFLPPDRCLRYGDGRHVEVGETYSMPSSGGWPSLCVSGMHASRLMHEALWYAPGPIACQVQVWGDVHVGHEKLCGWHRKVIAMYDMDPQLHQLELELKERWRGLQYVPIPPGRAVFGHQPFTGWIDWAKTYILPPVPLEARLMELLGQATVLT